MNLISWLSQDLPVIFHIFQLFESLATNVAIEKVLVFIFVVISFVNQQIVLFAESSVTIFAIVCFNHCPNLFPTPNMGRWVRMYNKHDIFKAWKQKKLFFLFYYLRSFSSFWKRNPMIILEGKIGFICSQNLKNLDLGMPICNAMTYIFNLSRHID